MPSSKLLRSLRYPTVLYQHLAGVESGYGFFAPNVPDSYNLRFEARSDGEAFVPLEVSSGQDNLRTASLLDYLGRYADGSLRQFILKLRAYSVLQKHPAITEVRISLETFRQPTIAEYMHGQRTSAKALCAYDFSPARRPEAATLP